MRTMTDTSVDDVQLGRHLPFDGLSLVEALDHLHWGIERNRRGFSVKSVLVLLDVLRHEGHGAILEPGEHDRDAIAAAALALRIQTYGSIANMNNRIPVLYSDLQFLRAVGYAMEPYPETPRELAVPDDQTLYSLWSVVTDQIISADLLADFLSALLEGARTSVDKRSANVDDHELALLIFNQVTPSIFAVWTEIATMHGAAHVPSFVVASFASLVMLHLSRQVAPSREESDA